MLSTRSLEKRTNTSTAKDPGIHLHEYQPNPSLRSSFKKSSIKPNCLAVNATHIFAAQADKSVVHVYSRERKNQEAVVPFQEQITCLALAGAYNDAGTLVMGTQVGRLILWELATGRQISTPQAHLQPVTCLAIDTTFSFLISGSSDSNLHVWSVVSLLSFFQHSLDDASQPLPLSPLRTLTNHRAGINAVIFGHSTGKANFAISAAEDKTCIVWDHAHGTVLHTYLLSDSPLCLALDPADRATYAGYGDGSIQLLDWYKQHSQIHPHHDPSQQLTPTQPPPSDRWRFQGHSSPALCLQVSYDGTALLSGHESGKVHRWSIAKGKYSDQVVDSTLPVTNLHMLPPTGFPNAPLPSITLHNVVKPRYESSLNSSRTNSIVPSNYTFTAQFTSILPLSDPPTHYSELDDALTHPSFPTPVLDEGLAELAALNTRDAHASSDEYNTLKQANISLKSQLDDALHGQREAIAKALQLEAARFQRGEDDAVRRARKKRRRVRVMEAEERRRKIIMGESVDAPDGSGDGDVGMSEAGEELSSDTDEMSSD
ncbi:MAG: hypothetical protein Q9207_002065 [Kuettlingeria erythrocarpa]